MTGSHCLSRGGERLRRQERGRGSRTSRRRRTGSTRGGRHRAPRNPIQRADQGARGNCCCYEGVGEELDQEGNAQHALDGDLQTKQLLCLTRSCTLSVQDLTACSAYQAQHVRIDTATGSRLKKGPQKKKASDSHTHACLLPRGDVSA